ncbi:MAG TPA: class I SAM-dependent methyltransferase [Terriglobales bacterium]|jgi:SAM-dependent methyltransferase
MMLDSEPYAVSSQFYDQAYAAKKDLVDVPFYLDLAKRIGGPVLEMGCGTGRVLLPIARAGIEIHGMDHSPSMLAILRKHLQREAQDVRGRVSLCEGDMRTFRSERKYALVTIPFRPMQHMYSVQDQIAALKTAAFHLQDNGILAFDVFYPRFDLILSGIGEEVLDLEWPAESDPTRIVRRYFRKESVDKINQNFTATFVFRTFEGEKIVHEEHESLRMSYYTYPHVKALIILAGLESVEEYGSFAKAPLDNNAPEMIFVLRRVS